MGRTDAARAVGINVRCALDIDKGLLKVGKKRIPFAPAGPDVRLYNRLMQSLEYVDGRVAVAVQQLPLHKVEKTISDRFLHVEDRETIADLYRQGYSMRAIARKMGRNVSTISRELSRGSDEFGLYRPHYAHRKSVAKRLRPKQRKVDANPQLAEAIYQRLAKCYSPEQIAGELRLEYPDDDTMHVCHETIYQMLYFQARGSLRKEITQALRQGRAHRVTRGQRKPRKRFVDDMVMIADRPAEVDDRAIPGHWEGDLILGAGNKTAIGTLVERTTRYTMLLHLPDGHSAEAVRDALIAKIRQLPQHLRQSLTWDQGSEMAGHKAFTVATDCPVYFCNPGSPWQRGTNENTNGLLRQYFPKGTDLSVYGPEELDAVAHELNDRPRKTLGYQKPSRCLAKLIQDDCCNDR
ncbi:IS30 family transposase [Corynebacterium aquilae]|uniref:IS30 family transposase n=1 Tax=Corynebacterium aquilae TaxID=203263 RepID=UPI0012EE217D|nr:IS30 family transposase [Corynebacterium aquilae]